MEISELIMLRWLDEQYRVGASVSRQCSSSLKCGILLNEKSCSALVVTRGVFDQLGKRVCERAKQTSSAALPIWRGLKPA